MASRVACHCVAPFKGQRTSFLEGAVDWFKDAALEHPRVISPFSPNDHLGRAQIFTCREER